MSATNFTAYDAMGQVRSSSQVTDGQTYTMSYAYDLAGNLTSQTYPSGRTVTTSFDNTGRVTDLSGQRSGEADKTYASAFSYAPHGGVSAMRLGNSLWETASYNTRLQPASLGLGTASSDTSRWKLSYDYGSTTNNGNVAGQTLTGAGLTLTQSYTYDQLNRLKTASESAGASWQRTYEYDRYGNRGVAGVNLPISPTTNRISAAGYAYDTAGNLTSMPGHSLAYDAENRQVSYDTGAARYYYDGDGRRVKKVAGGATTIFVYNADGQLVAEYGGSAASAGAGTSYLTADALGSTRVVTDQSGAVRARHDYLPFGEEVGAGVGGRTTGQGYSQPDGVRKRWAQLERDDETGLDFAQARYYSSTQGRFTSPDEFSGGAVDVFAAAAAANPTFYADLINPQSLNKYQYSYNNPLRYNDPTGHCPDCPQQGESWWEGIQSYFNSLGQRLLRQASPQGEPQDEQRVPGPLNMSRGEIVEKHSQMVGKGMNLNYAVMELVDPTGGVGVMWRLAKQDNTGAAIAGGGMMLGATSGFGGVTLREAKSLVGGWARDPVQNTIAASIRYHFKTHGAEVGAKNAWQYLRKAEWFARNLRGARTSQLEDGATRYMKKVKYIIKDKDEKIISFGLERQ